MFLKEVSYAQQSCIDLIKNTVKAVIVWNNCFRFYYILKCNLFLWHKAEFSAENSKEQYLFWIEIFCEVVQVFTVTFDQFNASLMNKKACIYFMKRTDLKHLNSSL